VDEGVRQDAEQPCLQVRSGMELVPRPHRLEQGVLDQIFRLGRIPRELARDGIEGVEMPHCLLRKSVGILFGFGRRRKKAHRGWLRLSLSGVTPMVSRLFLRSS